MLASYGSEGKYFFVRTLKDELGRGMGLRHHFAPIVELDRSEDVEGRSLLERHRKLLPIKSPNVHDVPDSVPVSYADWYDWNVDVDWNGSMPFEAPMSSL
jgi:hypothetical protein